MLWRSRDRVVRELFELRLNSPSNTAESGIKCKTTILSAGIKLAAEQKSEIYVFLTSLSSSVRTLFVSSKPVL